MIFTFLDINNLSFYMGLCNHLTGVYKDHSTSAALVSQSGFGIPVVLNEALQLLLLLAREFAHTNIGAVLDLSLIHIS